jgi:hypothetical protein
MKYLVYCTCGHALDRHASEGCGGEPPFLRCACDHTELEALDAAIEHARRNPWEGYQLPAAVGAGEGDAA